MRFERDDDGRVTSIESNEGAASFEYSNGAIVGYELADGLRASLTYGAGGEVATIEYGDTTEHWDWSDGVLRAVTIEDDRYELDWLALGILATVSRDGDDEMQHRRRPSSDERRVSATATARPSRTFGWDVSRDEPRRPWRLVDGD